MESDAPGQEPLIEVPDLLDLITSKLTYREKDAWDIAELKLLANPEPGSPALP